MMDGEVLECESVIADVGFLVLRAFSITLFAKMQ
jgi:hypothetical protein